MPLPLPPQPPTKRWIRLIDRPQRFQLFGFDENNKQLFITEYEHLEDAIRDGMRSSADRLDILGPGVNATTDTGVCILTNPLTGSDHTENDLTVYLLC